MALTFWSDFFHCFRQYRRNPETLVERLRLNAAGPKIHMDYYRADCAEAADEIERLRTELTNEQLRRVGFNTTGR